MSLHAKAPTNVSYPGGHGRSTRLLLSLVLLTAAALLLIPAAQALGASLKINVAGTGSGEVVTGTPSSGWSGSPLMACSYNGTAASGVCENTPKEFTSNEFREWLVANPAPGSEFGGWVVQRGEEHNETEFGCANGTCEGFTEFCPATENTGVHGANPVLECGFASVAAGEPNEWEVKATFCAEGTAIEQTDENKYWEASEPLLLGCGSPTPTFELTTEVSGPGEVSGPEDILCPSGSCSASFAEGETVTLTETPAAHAHFVEWTGSGAGSCSGQSTTTCEVAMSEDKTVKAVFAFNTHTLTVNPSGEGVVSGGPSPSMLTRPSQSNSSNSPARR